MPKITSDTILNQQHGPNKNFDTVRANDIFSKKSDLQDKHVIFLEDIDNYSFFLTKENHQFSYEIITKLQPEYSKSNFKKDFELGIDVCSYYYSDSTNYCKDSIFFKTISSEKTKEIQQKNITETKIEIKNPEKKFTYANSYFTDLSFITILFGFIIIAIVQKSGKNYLSNIFISIINSRFARGFYRENKNVPGKSKYLLLTNFFLNIGIFFALSALHLNLEIIHNSEYKTLAIIIICLILGSFFQNFIRKIISLTFGKSTENTEYIFNISISKQILGLLILPINILIAYSSDNIADYSMLIGIMLIALMKISDYIRLSNFFFISQISLLYLFLYLCTLEVLPLLSVFRILYDKIL